MKYMIEVTNEDIAKGAPDPNLCPIALAAQRAFNLSNVTIGCAFIHGGPKPLLPLPEEAKEFIAAFDRGFPVEPFAFEVEVSALASEEV